MIIQWSASIISKLKPKIIPRAKHNISRANIDQNALKVLYRLKDAGFAAYLVGGAVRDLLLNQIPKDFDVATDAHPEKIKSLFRNCILIGRRFRLAHIRFGREIVEVATFRASNKEHAARQKHPEHGMILRDNVYGTMQEDVWRRDFSINALYYNIEDFSVVDYVGGMKDLKAKKIRMLGDVVERYHEDPVRMLRAVRFAAKLNFKVATTTARPILKLSGLLQNVPSARIFDEVSKWFLSGKSLATFKLLRKYGLFAVLFPKTEAGLGGDNAEMENAMLTHGFQNTDKRIIEDKPINPAFLFAVMLWWPMLKQLETWDDGSRLSFSELLHHAMREVLKQQSAHILIPERLRLTIREIWVMQFRLEQRQKNRIYPLLSHPKFRAAYDFLLLRAEAGEKVKEVAEWWTKFQDAPLEVKKKMIEKLK